MATENDPLPGKGIFGWLGRQVGHVKKAVKTTPVQVQKKRDDSVTDTAADNNAAKSAKCSPGVIYREDKVEEAELPDQPGVKLRRTIIDEVIVERKEDSGT